MVDDLQIYLDLQDKDHRLQLGDEHVIPITDMSFLGIPKARF
jgi:hypothetical protein